MVGGGGSRVPGCSESQRAAQAKKEVLWGKEQPKMTAWGPSTQPEDLAPPLGTPHVNVCDGSLQMGLAEGKHLGPAPSGKEGVDAQEGGMPGAWLRAGGQPALLKLVPTLLRIPYRMLCYPCTS